MRRHLDKYRTPPWMTAHLLDSYPEITGTVLIDPCAGDCRMSSAVGLRFQRVLTNDLDASEPTDGHCDATSAAFWDGLPNERLSWVVSNPPFDVGAEIARLAVERVGNVALLLRCTFLEACAGREWLERRPPTGILSLKRAKFTPAGVDNAPCWWFLWGVQPGIKVRSANLIPGQGVLLA